MKRSKITNLVLAAMFLALAFVIPQILKSIPFFVSANLGTRLLPMHLPVLLCGLICGYYYGATVGFIAPLLTSLITSMPPMYPVAISMAFELATYGLVAGLMYKISSRLKINYVLKVYIDLITAMLAGRVVMEVVNMILLTNGKYGLKIFLADAFVNALPGIIVQLILIPAILITLRKAKYFK